MIEKIRSLWENRRWNLYLYYDGIRIKRLKVYRDELDDLKNKEYEINVFFKKQLFKSNIVNIIVSPKVILHTDDIKRKVCIGVVIERGIEL
jgi:hypothetical protein